MLVPQDGKGTIISHRLKDTGHPLKVDSNGYTWEQQGIKLLLPWFESPGSLG